MADLLCAYCLLSNEHAAFRLRDNATGKVLEPGAWEVVKAHEGGAQLGGYDVTVYPVRAVTTVAGTAVCEVHVEAAWQRAETRPARPSYLPYAGGR